MQKLNTFEEIISWKKSRLFNRRIYLVTEDQKFKKDFDLTRQIRRASVSISSNIAEGFERNTDKEFIYFLYIAKASAGEVRSQIYLAFDLNYISKGVFDNLLSEITEISKLLGGFIKYLEKNKIEIVAFKGLSTFDFRLSDYKNGTKRKTHLVFHGIRRTRRRSCRPARCQNGSHQKLRKQRFSDQKGRSLEIYIVECSIKKRLQRIPKKRKCN